MITSNKLAFNLFIALAICSILFFVPMVFSCIYSSEWMLGGVLAASCVVSSAAWFKAANAVYK